MVPRVIQVDSSSNFLGNTPHWHPMGILRCKRVWLPAEGVEAAQLMVENITMQDMKNHVEALTNCLWSWKHPIETADLRRGGEHSNWSSV